MKKFMAIIAAMLLFGMANEAYAVGDLDTVTNDGRVEEFVQQEVSTSQLEMPYVEGSGVGIENLVPNIPKDAIYISDRIDGTNSESIIGSDNRRIVGNTAIYPYSSCAFLQITFPTGRTYIGSGNLVSSDLVLTAGHCIYNKTEGGWATSVAVYPGYNGATAPFGVSNATKLMSVSGWTSKESPEHDIGAIKLDKKIGDKTGWFGLIGNASGNITLTGFHGDLNGRMGTESGSISRLTANNVFYKLDSTGGSSGSGVYNNSKQILAVHAYGTNSENFGTRLNTDKFNVVSSWISNGRSPSTFKPNDIVRLSGGATVTTSWSSNKSIHSKYLNEYYRIERVEPLASPKWNSEYQVLISSYSNDFRGWVYEQDLNHATGAKYKRNSSVHLSRSAKVSSRYWNRRTLDSKYLSDNYTIVDIATTAESKSPYQYRIRHRTLGDLWVLEQDLYESSKFDKNDTVKLQPFATNAGSWSSNKKIDQNYFQKTFRIVDIARAPQSNSKYQYRIRYSNDGAGDIWVLEQDLKK